MDKTRKIEEPLYLQLYEYYRNLIELGRMQPGEKLPSIRKCALERQISKTTVENSYMQLCAEGYIQSVAGSGYYVSEAGFNKIEQVRNIHATEKQYNRPILYDFASSKVDDKSFNFDLWRRYMKSALRHTDRLVGYGNPQGEYDLRVALGNYVKEARRVVCSPEQIVIGAGVQSLLSILCALTGERQSICFTGNPFKQGEAVFKDRGHEVYYRKQVDGAFDFFREKQIKALYVSPSHINAFGEVMPMKMRKKLLDFAARENCLIIEDDYDSEFRYYTRPMPALQSLDSGQKVVYLGSFSRLLLPSLRIAFMVLPAELMPIYYERGHLYNQTASTAEQIALCQFIRDGHLKKQIKKARKIYMSKAQQLCKSIHEVFKEQVKAEPVAGGFLVRMEVNSPQEADVLVQKAQQVGISLRGGECIVIDDRGKQISFLLSCSGTSEVDFKEAALLLKKTWEKDLICLDSL